MSETTPHVRLSTEGILHITNPSILRDPAFDNYYTEKLADDATGSAAGFITPEADGLSVSVDIPAWHRQANLDPKRGSAELLSSLGTMLLNIPDDGDSFIGISYHFASGNYTPGSFSGTIHPSAQRMLNERFPLGRAALQRIAQGMMFAFETPDGLNRAQSSQLYYPRESQESINYDNFVGIRLSENRSFNAILPTFTTQGDATNWIVSPRYNRPCLFAHNLDYHYQVLSYILGAAALTNELLAKSP